MIRTVAVQLENTLILLTAKIIQIKKELIKSIDLSTIILYEFAVEILDFYTGNGGIS